MHLKSWKNLLLWVLVLGLLFSLCACGKTTEPVGSLSSDPAQTDARDPKPDTEPAKEPEETQAPIQVARPCPDNILMAQTGDNYKTPVFGNEAIYHEDVTSVTFLDTLAGMPADAWDVSLDQNGSVMAWLENGTDLFIAGNGGVTASNCKNLFMRFRRMTSVNFNDCFYTDNVTSMYYMFSNCWGLTELDLSFFNTSNVETFSSMFNGCMNLVSLDLSSFDTSKAYAMNYMFSGCEKLESVDLSSFNTSNVNRFDGMFSSCSSITALDLRNFDTSIAGLLDGMFYACSSLTELDISSFDTSRAGDMTQMFQECESLTSLDLSHFDTSNVTRFGAMFEGCKNLEMLDVSSFRTSKATSFASMFANCPKLTSLDLSGFDFSQAELTSEMFALSYNLSDIHCTITLPEGCDATNMYQGSPLQ